MMDTETQKNIQEQFERLPKDVKDAVTSTRVREQIQSIGKKHELHIDQMGALETETLFVMIGLEHPREYIRNVARELRIQNDKAQKIAVDINENVFRPVRESLKSIHEITDQNQTGEHVPQNQNQEGEKPKMESLLRLKKDFATTVRPTIPYNAIKTEAIIKTDDTTKPEEKVPERPFFKITPLKKNAGDETADAPRFTPHVESLSVPKTFENRSGTQKTVPPPQNLPVENSLEKKTAVAIKDDNIGDKLTKTFSIPRAETTHHEGEETPQKKDNRYGSNDPYREPVN